MDGLIILNKPRGITSAKALYRVRKLTGQKKSGHAGTLDPDAEGVLILCLGKATKLVERLMGLPKVYWSAARLDATSASFDSDGLVQELDGLRAPERGAVENALAGFRGTIEQTPPAISAIKIGGQPAYKLVRKSQTPVMRARPVTVHWIHLRKYEWPTIEFEMCCGRGTYVRSIIRDLGQNLGTGGCLTRLIRSAVGGFTIERACSLESFDQTTADTALIPLDVAAAMIEAAQASGPPADRG